MASVQNQVFPTLGLWVAYLSSVCLHFPVSDGNDSRVTLTMKSVTTCNVLSTLAGTCLCSVDVPAVTSPVMSTSITCSRGSRPRRALFRVESSRQGMLGGWPDKLGGVAGVERPGGMRGPGAAISISCRPAGQAAGAHGQGGVVPLPRSRGAAGQPGLPTGRLGEWAAGLCLPQC